MILKNYTPWAMFLYAVFRNTYIFSWSTQDSIILYQNTVMQNCDTWRGKISIIIVKPRRSINDVISLPFTRLFGCIHKWSMLFIDTGRLSISISTVVVTIENLHLITFL